MVSLYFLAEDIRYLVAKTIVITRFQHLNLFPPPICLHFYLPLFSGIQSICLVFLLFYPSFHKRTTNTRVRLSCVYSAFSYLAFLPYVIILIDKPANKKQVLFSKVFLLKMSITNKPVFFIWFVEMHIFISLLIYFHYSCIINSQKLVESCYLCNLTCFAFSLFLFNEIIYRVSTFFLHDQTSHCFESYFSKG